MKTKIFNALKQAYSSLGLGDEVLQEQAGALAATGLVTDEKGQRHSSVARLTQRCPQSVAF